MTHGGWQGSGGAGPGPRAPARSRCRPGPLSLPCRPNPPEAPGRGSALRPWDLAARTPLPCFCDRSWALGKLLGPKRLEGRKGRERRRRGPGGQQPQPAGEQTKMRNRCLCRTKQLLSLAAPARFPPELLILRL
ncbi:uncharacterized protein LOC112629890 [Theropithecus gelada]|uniref:uncharacterized protein LOC112629890 n=1 Tax=Theropithecus gelada TaxID=9565 RepID=UPI000DC1879A|nr:uncharacterized protein LOC112629890 [Theropithecus gelada]